MGKSGKERNDAFSKRSGKIPLKIAKIKTKKQGVGFG